MFNPYNLIVMPLLYIRLLNKRKSFSSFLSPFINGFEKHITALQSILFS